jgi:hypothetical protein
MGKAWTEVMRVITRWDTQEWTLVLVAAIVAGFFCLRGFGSRSGY